MVVTRTFFPRPCFPSPGGYFARPLGPILLFSPTFFSSIRLFRLERHTEKNEERMGVSCKYSYFDDVVEKRCIIRGTTRVFCSNCAEMIYWQMMKKTKKFFCDIIRLCSTTALVVKLVQFCVESKSRDQQNCWGWVTGLIIEVFYFFGLK